MTAGGPTLEHVTAGTGHVRASPRFEVGAAAVEALAPMLPARGGFVPGFEGWTWRGWTVGGALCFDVLAPDGAAALRCAASPGGDPEAWQATADAARVAGGVDPASPPPDDPWLLSAIRPGIFGGHLAALAWLPDFARCLAWAWIEGGGGAGGEKPQRRNDA